MRPATALALGGATAVGLAATAHVAPTLAGVSPLGLWCAPGLVGRGRTDHVALTFDDGPDPASTPQFLDVLDRLGWHATFFMLGTMARRAPGLVREIAAAGHEVAVHGDEHRNLLRRSPGATAADIGRARATIAELSDTSPVWFRPPYGALSLAALRAARTHGLRSVLWTTWGKDWRAESTAQNVTALVLRHAVAGGTVLLHDSDCVSSPGAWRATLGALPRLADAFAAQGLTVGPLREHQVGRTGSRAGV